MSWTKTEKNKRRLHDDDDFVYLFMTTLKLYTDKIMENLITRTRSRIHHSKWERKNGRKTLCEKKVEEQWNDDLCNIRHGPTDTFTDRSGENECGNGISHQQRRNEDKAEGKQQQQQPNKRNTHTWRRNEIKGNVKCETLCFGKWQILQKIWHFKLIWIVTIIIDKTKRICTRTRSAYVEDFLPSLLHNLITNDSYSFVARGRTRNRAYVQ